MADSLGTIRGQMILDVKQALASYTAARAAHVSTVTALHTGAGAMIQSGAAIAGVGAVMAAGLLTAVGAAAEFEKKLDYFMAVSDTAAGDYQKVSDKALQLGADTKYSASEIADSFIELGKSGVSAKDIIGGIGEAVANLGAAADLPLDTAANIVTAAVATFGLAASDAVGIVDKLAGAANASIIDVEDLGVSLKYAGGVAASLGVPFEDLNTALALLGKNGIKGSTAGTSLRQILLGLNGTTPKATEALKELGIITEDGGNKFFTAEGKAKSLSEVFQVLQEATAGMSDKQKTATLQQIFATRALPSLIALTNQGADGFANMAAQIDKTTALEVAGKRLDNLSGDIEILKGNLDTLFISGGGGFQEFARGVIQNITGLVQGFMDLPQSIQTGAFAVIGIVGALLIFIGTAGMMAGSILNIIALAIQMKDVMIALKVAQGLATAAQWLLNIAMAANPIGLIVAAVIALIAIIVLLVVYWDQVKAAFQDQKWLGIIFPILGLIANFEELKQDFLVLGYVLGKVWDDIVKWFQNGVKMVQDIIGKIGSTLFSLFVQPWINAGNEIVGFFSWLWTTVTTGIANFITGAVTFFQELPGKIIAFLQVLPGMIGYIIGFVIGSLVRMVIQVATFIAQAFNNIVTFFQELPGKIVAFLTTLFTNIINFWLMVGQWLGTNVPLIIEAIANFFAELPGRVLVFFTELFTNITNFWLGVGAWLAEVVPQIITNLINFFSGLPAVIGQFFLDVGTNIAKFFNDAKNKAIEIATGIFNGIRDALAGLPGLIGGIFNNVFNAIKNLVTGAFNAMRNFAAGLWEGFKDGLGIHSPSYIEHAMWAITDVTETETNRLADQVKAIQHLGNGITEVGNNLGVGFGNNFDRELISLYDQMQAAKNMQVDILGTSQVLPPRAAADAANADALATIDETLKGLKVETNQYDIDINNPTAEPASTSLPNVIRDLAYVDEG